MKKFKAEVKAIQLILKGSRWANDPETGMVLDEYQRIIDSNSVKSREKRVALQIMFSSRAIDTMLAHVTRADTIRRGNRPEPYYVLEASLRYLRGTGLITGRKLSNRTYIDLCNNVKDKRNKYLHQAGVFPNDLELTRFLSSTVNGMREVSKL